MTTSTPGLNRLSHFACLLALLSGTPVAWAGRPLATDDAGSADVGTCQMESWIARDKSDRAWIVAPACGIAQGLELGLDYALPRPPEPLRAAAGMALKWAPEAWRLDTPAGELNLGFKLGAWFGRPARAAWRHLGTGALALVTLAPRGDWTLHLNLGPARDHDGAATATLLNLAAVWKPDADGLLFVEAQAKDRRAMFGDALVTAGGRWWLIRDRFGLDLTASRENGTGSATLWTVGLGWYGQGL